MAYVVEVSRVFRELHLPQPGVALWGHCEFKGRQEEYSCGVTFEKMNWQSPVNSILPITFYWTELPFDAEGKELVFYSASEKIFQGNLRRLAGMTF